MKYMEYYYIVDKPIDKVFARIIDLKRLQDDIEYFKKADVTTNDLAPDQIGKAYYIRQTHSDITTECKIEVVKVQEPTLATLEYTYRAIEKDGAILESKSFLPWKSMSCAIGFEEEGDKTRITTVMVANGVESFLAMCTTKLFSWFNIQEQKRVIRRVKKYINETL